MEPKIVPQEIVNVFLKYEDAKECQELAVRFSLSYKRALKYAQQARRLREKAWGMVYELYPELEDQSLTLNYKSRTVTLERK